MASIERLVPAAEGPPAPDVAPEDAPRPEGPDRPHGDPLAPEVPTEPPVQPADDPTVDRSAATVGAAIR